MAHVCLTRMMWEVGRSLLWAPRSWTPCPTGAAARSSARAQCERAWAAAPARYGSTNVGLTVGLLRPPPPRTWPPLVLHEEWIFWYFLDVFARRLDVLAHRWAKTFSKTFSKSFNHHVPPGGTGWIGNLPTLVTDMLWPLVFELNYLFLKI